MTEVLRGNKTEHTGSRREASVGVSFKETPREQGSKSRGNLWSGRSSSSEAAAVGSAWHTPGQDGDQLAADQLPAGRGRGSQGLVPGPPRAWWLKGFGCYPHGFKQTPSSN